MNGSQFLCVSALLREKKSAAADTQSRKAAKFFLPTAGRRDLIRSRISYLVLPTFPPPDTPPHSSYSSDTAAYWHLYQTLNPPGPGLQAP